MSPVTANTGQSECTNVNAGGTGPALPVPVTGNALSARTSAVPATAAPGAQKASATSEVASLSIGAAGLIWLPPVPQ